MTMVEKVARAIYSAYVENDNDACDRAEIVHFKHAPFEELDETDMRELTAQAQAAIEATGVVELRELLLASTEWLESVIAAMDQYNEKHGTYIIGPSLFGAAKQIAFNREALTQLAKGSE